MFENCVANDFVPKVIVLCGNFTTQSISHGDGRDIQRYQENFDALADLIASFPDLTAATHFVFVPGPLDIALNGPVLPRKPLMSAFTARLRTKVPHVHFATNPCRIKFFHQEIVVFREDLMARMLRNMVGVKPDVAGEDLKRYVSWRRGWVLGERLTKVVACADGVGSGAYEPVHAQHSACA